MASAEKVSPALRTLIDKGLLDRLPPTFSTYFFDQIQDWELLFPAERGYYEWLFGLLDRSEPALVDRLFAPLRYAEQQMGVNEKTWPRRHFNLDQVDFLNRSPHYPEWRKAVTDIFARVDPLLDDEVARVGHARLVVVTAPAELPVGPDRMWLRIRRHGKSISLEQPEELADYLPILLTGGGKKDGAPTIAERYMRGKFSERYAAWTFDADGLFHDFSKIFYQYIWQEFGKYPEYRHNTAYLFVGEGMDELLAVAPPDFPLTTAQPVKLAEVFGAMKDWLNL